MATERQIAFVRNLIAQRDVDAAWLDQRLHGNDDLSEWSNYEVSELIDELKAFPWKAREEHKGFLGEVGQRISVEGEIITRKHFAAQRYGWSNSILLVIKTDDNKLVKTFTSALSAFETERGDRVSITGTVKGHETYRGDDQTVLNRVKVEVLETRQDRHWAARGEISLQGEDRQISSRDAAILASELEAEERHREREVELEAEARSRVGSYRAQEAEELLGHFSN